MNVPVQVDGRIIDCVDECRAASMGRGSNTTIIRSHKTGKIARIIVKSMSLGRGDMDCPTSHMDSRRGHRKEVLFNTDDAPKGEIKGMPFVFVPMYSALSKEDSKPKLKTIPKRASRRKGYKS